jgi:drug/metabolite transporter (DMT)-like permease
VVSITASRARIWVALAVVYVVWGSTYLGIDLAVRTIPPFLMAALRFLIAGGLLSTRGQSAGATQVTGRPHAIGCPPS